MRWEIYIVTALIATLVIAVETIYIMQEHPRARRAGLVSVFGIVLFPVAIVLHNVLSALMRGEEAVSFILGVLVAPAAITFGTLGVAYLIADRMPLVAVGFTLAGVGLLALPAYVLSAVVVSAMGAEMARDGLFEAIALPASLVALAGGVIVVAFALAAPRRAAHNTAI
jgi:hypothetical protein